ncbi:MAG: tRNA pseudouridine(55) synthase TruB, partial [Steroidobacteraceae bacterium]
MSGGAPATPGWRRDVDGIVLLDKPEGLSSNAALQRVRRAFGARKAGHTGSLDPLASGLLPICLGQATKTSGLLLDADKTYRFRVALGASTTTGDREGEVVERAPVPALDEAELRRRVVPLVGDSMQVPPMYSALKHEGERLYRLARQGVEVERQPRPVRIHRLDLLDAGPGWLDFVVACSKGTYVRSLAEDIARACGSVGHVALLRRTALGPFTGARMHTLEEIERSIGAGSALESMLLPVDGALPGLPAVLLD